MINFEETVRVNCPIERVFAFIVDEKNLRNWQTGLVENELLTEGPLRAGTRFREVRRMGPRDAEIQGEITDFVPNQLFGTRTLTEPKVTASYALEQADGGTRIRYRFTMQSSGWMRLLEPIFATSIKKDSAADLAKLKRILES